MINESISRSIIINLNKDRVPWIFGSSVWIFFIIRWNALIFKFINLYKAKYFDFVINNNPKPIAERSKSAMISFEVPHLNESTCKGKKVNQPKNVAWSQIFWKFKESTNQKDKNSDLLSFDSCIHNFFNSLAKNGATFLKL